MQSLQEYSISSEKHVRRAYIISNKTFCIEDKDIQPRNRTDVDWPTLFKTLQTLNFKITMNEVKINQTAQQMKQIAEKVANDIENSTEIVDLMLFIVLSYGEFGVLYGTDGPLQSDSIIAHFKGDKCTKLAGKPKLFMFQACCPEFYGIDRRVSSVVADHITSLMPQKKMYKIPAEADIHVLWSLVPISLGKDLKTSIFVGALVKVLGEEVAAQKNNEDAREYNQLITQVLCEVDSQLENVAAAEYRESKYLLPCAINMLTKSLYFRLAVSV